MWALIRPLMARDDDMMKKLHFRGICSMKYSWKTNKKGPYSNRLGPLHPGSPTDPAVVQASLDHFVINKKSGARKYRCYRGPSHL